MAPSLQQKLFVEFVGTALLCFTVSCLPKVAEDMVGITVGGVLMLLVYAGGPQSGGHYNPAVTLAFLGRGLIDAKEAALYVVAQAVAAVAGAALASGLYPFDEAAFPAPAEGVGVLAALVAELCWTWTLAYVVLIRPRPSPSTGPAPRSAPSSGPASSRPRTRARARRRASARRAEPYPAPSPPRYPARRTF